MAQRIKKIALPFLLSLSVTCASPPEGLFPPRDGEPAKPIYIVNHGWHAGIVLRGADVPPDLWPERRDFSLAEYLEVGWGDRDYYMSSRPGACLLLNAALLPTASVLHVVGFRGSVADYFPGSEIIRVNLSAEGFKRLVSYLDNSFDRDGKGRAPSLGPGLYGDSRFYPSRETYHAFNTCNVWVARALRAAGCPLTPGTKLRVEDLMSAVAEFGTPLRAGAVLQYRITLQ